MTGGQGLRKVTGAGAPLRVPAVTGVLLLALAGWPQIHSNPAAAASMLGAGVSLLGGTLALWLWSRSRAVDVFPLEFRAFRPHWVQSLAQLGVFVYWGWYVRTVYDFVPYLLAQLLFAYGFEALLTLYRRRRYTLGFGPVPIVFSINLFLWFKPDWFYLQFLMIAVGYLVKQFVRWNRDGRPTHIFNPSSFPLAVASIALIMTGASDMTFGLLIASTQAVPPHMYLVIFLVALPGQVLFGVAPMTMAAVVTGWLLSQVHLALTGSLFFQGVYIPVAVFLGMHLLFTDPSTSPRTELGRVLFGILYGAGIVATAALLLAVGAPGFYDKLLMVPILNLAARPIDRWVRGLAVASRWSTAIRWKGLRINVAVVGLWIGLFTIMSVSDVFEPDRVEASRSELRGPLAGLR